MSTTVMAACWPLQMPPTQKAVLVSLADNANDTGHCWPSINKIAERTCFGRTAVMAAIAWLEENGAITADRSNGRHTSYMVTPSTYNQSVSRTGPAEQPVRQADTTSPAGGPHQSVSRTAPVRQADSNRKEPSRTAKSNRHIPATSVYDFSTWPDEPDPGTFADWLAMRKQKRAPVTGTVIRGMGKQLHIAAGMGWSVDECLTECAVRNWQGLRAEWLESKVQKRDGPLCGVPGKTVQSLQNLEAMKNGSDMDPQRDSDRLPEARHAQLGSPAGG